MWWLLAKLFPVKTVLVVVAIGVGLQMLGVDVLSLVFPDLGWSWTQFTSF